MMQQWTAAVIVLFTISAMLSVGLETTFRALVSSFTDRGLLSRALLAVLVVVPLLGLVAVRIAGLRSAIAAGILLMTLSPGALFALQFTRKAGSSACAVALQLLFVGLGLVLTPLVSRWLVPGESAYRLGLPGILALVIAVMLLPLAAGVELHRLRPAFAAKLRRPIGLVAGASFLLSFWVLLQPMKSRAEASVGADAIVTMLALVCASILAGWLLGGPDPHTRLVFSAQTSMRNVALAVLIAHQAFADRLVREAVIAYGAIMIPPNFIFSSIVTRVLKRRDARLEREARQHAAQ